MSKRLGILLPSIFHTRKEESMETSLKNILSRCLNIKESKGFGFADIEIICSEAERGLGLLK